MIDADSLWQVAQGPVYLAWDLSEKLFKEVQLRLPPIGGPIIPQTYRSTQRRNSEINGYLDRRQGLAAPPGLCGGRGPAGSLLGMNGLPKGVRGLSSTSRGEGHIGHSTRPHDVCNTPRTDKHGGQVTVSAPFRPYFAPGNHNAHDRFCCDGRVAVIC